MSFPWRLSAAVVPAAALLVMIGCQPSAPAPTQQQPADNSVTTARPERKTIRRTVEQPGYIEAFEQTPIYAKIPGYVEVYKKDIGDKVLGPQYDDSGKQTAPGDLLAKLWVPEMDEELKQKAAQ